MIIKTPPAGPSLDGASLREETSMRVAFLRSLGVTLSFICASAAVAQTSGTCNSGSSRPYEGAPVNGSPIVIAGSGTTTFEAEHFNCGAEGQAYHDLVAGVNAGQTFRADNEVEIIDIPPTTGLAVNHFDTGEWMEYTVSLASAATVDLAIQASSNNPTPGQYRIEIDGADVTGSITVPITGNWDVYQWVDGRLGLPLGAGLHTLRLFSVQQSFRIDKLRFVATAPATACNSGASRPYQGPPVNGNPIAVPATGATFEAEHFNCGGEGQAFHDLVAGVNAGQTFRADNEVEIIDIPPTTGLAVNHFDTGEWMMYSINVAAAGNYDLAINASSNNPTPGQYRIEIDGADVTGSVTVPITGNWDVYQWVPGRSNLPLAAGPHQLRLVSVTQSFRIDQLRVTPTPSGDCGTSNLCIHFEAAPDSQFASPAVNELTTRTLSTSVTWFVENKGFGACDGDRADDASRIGLASFGRDGASALRFTTLDKDDCVHSSGSMERSEIEMSNTDTAATNGADQWWAHSLFVPVDSTLGSATWWSAGFLQFHGNNGGQPNFILQIMNQGGTNPHLVFRAYSAGAGGLDNSGTQYTYSIGSDHGIIGQCIFDNPQKGVWYDFVHHIHWSNTGSGRHQIWMRQAGGPVIKVLDKPGINTLYAGDTAFLKMGAYHDPVVGANTSVIHDRLRRGDTADAVRMPDFPVDPNAPVTLCSGVTSP
jgi:hypothetical protein